MMQTLIFLAVFVSVNAVTVLMIRLWDLPEKEKPPLLPHQMRDPYP